jgi:hypothetical protein
MPAHFVQVKFAVASAELDAIRQYPPTTAGGHCDGLGQQWRRGYFRLHQTRWSAMTYRMLRMAAKTPGLPPPWAWLWINGG